MILLVAFLGLVAGILTTVSGLGGGLVLVTALSAVWGPHQALPATALGLLIGNLHRLILYRHHVRMDVARPLIVGLVPGSLVGAYLVSALPTALLQATMLILVALALGRAVLGWTWRLPPAGLVPAGVAVGVMAATGGGAAVLTCPLLLATGIRGDEYMATVAVAAAAMHVSRTVGYAAGGLVDPSILAWAGFLAVMLVLGNLCGRAIRDRLPERTRTAIEYAALSAAALFSLSGMS